MPSREVSDSKREDRFRALILAGLIALTWAALWSWGQSPYGTHWHHPAMAPVIFSSVRPAILFAFGWMLMTVAMMLPTSLPLLRLFHRVVDNRETRTWLTALCIAGYLWTWAIFGFVALAGVYEFSRFFDGVNFQAGLLVLSGLYQFTPLKYHCLQKCRSPFSFVTSHWHGRHEARESFLLGIHHGLFCIGCCWSLMLLMFLAVNAHTFWMLVLGTVMAVEKNAPWGKRISTPFGIVLIGMGVILKAVTPV
jgi:predicted metal-binding membrane protein